jgi:HD-like signal output (HDOD) protein
MVETVKQCNTCGRQFKSDSDFLTGTSRWRRAGNGSLWFNCSCESTLFLPPGKYAFYSPARQMSVGAQMILNDLSRQKEFTYLSPATMELQSLLSDENSSAGSLAKVTLRDPILGARLISYANIRKKPDAPDIVSLEHALASLGHSVLSDLVINASLTAIPCATVRYVVPRIWLESILSGEAAEILAARAPAARLTSEEAFLMGSLVPSVGKLLSAIYFPDKVDRLFEATQRSGGGFWETVERGMGIPNHALLAEIGCALWGMPEFIVKLAHSYQSQERLFQHSDVDYLRRVIVAFSAALTARACDYPAYSNWPGTKASLEAIGMSHSESVDLVRQLFQRRKVLEPQISSWFQVS